MGRFITNLFKPKEIGKYINDHIGFIVCYLIFFLLVCSIPDCVKAVNTPKISYSDEIVLFNSFSNSTESNYVITSNGLSVKNQELGTPEEVYNGSSISIAFNSSNVDNTMVLIFKDTYVNVYYEKTKVDTINYSELNISSLSIKDIQDKNFTAIDTFVSLINTGYNSVLKVIVPTYIGSIIIQKALLLGFILILLTWFSSSFNPQIDFLHRFKICSYALSWGFIFDFIGTVTGVGFLMYVGVVISFVFAFKALRNIVKVTVRK